MKKRIIASALTLTMLFVSSISALAAESGTNNTEDYAFGVASYQMDTGEVNVTVENEIALASVESEAAPYIPDVMPLAEIGMDEATQSQLDKMGLLTEDGEFDFDAFAELPTLDGNADELVPETVIGTDNRTVVSDTTAEPYRYNCYLAATFPDGNTYRGTAFTMGPSIVGTCGHNLYGSDNGGWATSIVIIAARNGSNQPYGTASGTSLHVGSDWYNSGAQNDDWGMVELSSELGNTVGYYGMSVRGDSQVGKNATITGYPKQVQNYSNSYQMWTHTNSITKLQNNMYYYTIDTTGGNSGSAVCDGQYVIGIHAYGSSSNNSGRALDQGLFNFFMQYR